MSRIFLVLSLIASAVLIYACIDGLMVGDYHAATEEFLDVQREYRAAKSSGEVADDLQIRFDEASQVFNEGRRRAGWHMLAGTAAALLALLVNCLSVTYFIGTGRWCKEVCETYKLSSDYWQKSDTIKRRSFPWSLGGVILLLVIISTGPPCDPLANLGGDASRWTAPHRYISLVATALMGVSFLRQVVYIRSHYLVIGEILGEVKRVREEKGLDLDDGPQPAPPAEAPAE